MWEATANVFGSEYGDTQILHFIHLKSSEIPSSIGLLNHFQLAKSNIDNVFALVESIKQIAQNSH